MTILKLGNSPKNFQIKLGTITVQPKRIYDQEIQYLQTDGYSYIDSGIIPQYNYGSKCRFRITEPSATIQDSLSFFGTVKVWNNSMWGMLWTSNIGASPNRFYVLIGKANNSKANMNQSNYVNTWNEITLTSGKLYLNNTLQCSVNSVLSGSAAYSSYVGTCKLGATGRYGTGTIRQISSYSMLDNNNKILLDLIPVMIDNEGCFYDKISNTLFHNKGTKPFILGPTV